MISTSTTVTTSNAVIENRLTSFLYILACITLAAQVLNRGGIVSALIAIIFALTFVLLGVTWIREFAGIDLLAIVILLFSFISIFAGTLSERSNVSFEYMRKWIMFSSTIAFLTSAMKFRADQPLTKLVIRGSDILTLFFIEEYFRQGRAVFYLNGLYTRYLCFHFTNPNLTALFLLCIAMMEITGIANAKKFIAKFAHAAMAAALSYFVYQTQSRNSLLVLILFAAVFAFVQIFRKPEYRTSKILSALIAVYPLLFVLIYLKLIDVVSKESIFAPLVEEGKSLNSREQIWTSTVRLFQQSPVIGAYYQMSGGTGISQAHNTCLDILVSYGTVVFVLVVVLLVRLLYEKGVVLSKGRFLYLAAFACLLMAGSGEAALFSGGLCIQIMVGIFLTMMRAEESHAD